MTPSRIPTDLQPWIEARKRFQSFRRPHPDGTRAGHEPEEARQTRQSPAGTVEGSASRIHRGVVRQAVREVATGAGREHRRARQGASQRRRRSERQSARPGERPAKANAAANTRLQRTRPACQAGGNLASISRRWAARAPEAWHLRSPRRQPWDSEAQTIREPRRGDISAQTMSPLRGSSHSWRTINPRLTPWAT